MDTIKACQIFVIYHKKLQQEHTMQPCVFWASRQPVPKTPDEMGNWQAVELNNPQNERKLAGYLAQENP